MTGGPGSIIWLVSYPKSGNTWLRAMISGLTDPEGTVDINRLQERSQHGATRRLFDAYAGVPSSDLTPDEVAELRPAVYEAISAANDAPIFLKLHDAYRLTNSGAPMFPRSATLGVVYLVRNPLDVACSYAHHRGRGTDETIRVMADPTHRLADPSGAIAGQLVQLITTWSAHVSSWLRQFDIDVLTIRYEDLHATPAETLARVAALAGLTEDEGRIRRSIRNSSFTMLRNQEMSRGFVEGSRDAGTFFRKGARGSWPDELSEKQVSRIVRDHGDVMKQFGYLPASHERTL